ncbi:hypothetical protein ABZS66_31555 [Dactylosporangium sp. NPDC005572]|uniref:hypothetical protein n=1 Tax=Dactylosporangium sp. NPDC005572 TaxID=3156889 RepID=UPI0033AB402E
MGHWLIAVLVRADAHAEFIRPQLALPLRPLIAAGRIDGYRLGGQVTGAWDPGYDPAADPANWRPCEHCGSATRTGHGTCTSCADAVAAGRPPGTVVAWWHGDWAPHQGDIVPLARLMAPNWRFPKNRTPIAWADLAGVEFLDTEHALLTGTDTGEIPPRLAQIFDDLHTGHRDPHQRPAQRPGQPNGRRSGQRRDWHRPADETRFDPNRYAVAVVDTHH